MYSVLKTVLAGGRCWPGFALIIILQVQAVFSQTTYEAESAVLANGAYSVDSPACSGGKMVWNIGGENNGSVTFEHVRAPRVGLYPLTVLYQVGDDRPSTITVNNNTQFEQIFISATNQGDSRKTILVPLNAGDNRLTFDNAKESAPDLDAIIVGDAPVDSADVSGMVTNADGSSVAGAEIILTGGSIRAKTVTDAHGRYEFPCLPKGDYYVRPAPSAGVFSPFEIYSSLSTTSISNGDFVVQASPPDGKDIVNLPGGHWRVAYDLATGRADFFHDDNLLIPQAFAVVRLPETVTSMDFPTHRVTQESIHDGFGSGVKFTVESTGRGADKMIQTFWLYDQADYFLTGVAISGKSKVASNFMAPLVSQTPAEFLPAGDDRALFVPFDNDKWIRYDAVPFGSKLTSYEVSALYNNSSRQGLVIGSIEHDTWKTGVETTTSSNAVTSLEIFGGIASSATRDVLPHGKISGTTLKSPKVFVGCFSDWRDGLEAYARANAVVTPPRAWDGGVPFGWNSWGKLQESVTFEKAVQVSDFFASHLQPNHFENHGVVYVGLDAGWSKFSDAELKQFAEHCRSNHQEAGIYFAPFAVWHPDDEAPVPGTSYQYKDIYLYANGRKQVLDGGIALDPTHPGTKQLIKTTIQMFKRNGFKYVKADFMTQGALESDHFFDPQVTTGIQAYNEGMKFISDTLGKKMFLNLSISPLFPAQYADSRRIACDTFGRIDQVEYMLNSLTYGWWLAHVYDFNDPDHMVLGGYAEGENRARVTSAAITGNFISGDDFSDGGDATGKARAETFLTNPDVNAVARIQKSFRPAEGDTDSHAGNLFSFQDKNDFYLAVFNYSNTNASFEVDLNRLGFQTPGPLAMKNLWNGTVTNVSSPMIIQINAGDAELYKFYQGNVDAN